MNTSRTPLVDAFHRPVHVERLHQIPGIRDISLTTNGTMITAKSIGG